jgi:DNA-binding protein H-NS
MKSLVQLQTEIQTLQKQAADLRTREYDRTVKDIVQQMAAFGITLAVLKVAMQRVPKPGRPKAKGKGKARVAGKAKAKPAKAKTRKPAAIKFRGPGGEAWSGRGKTPTWLKALVDAGRKADEFRVQ